jgi:hypothetical protein
MINKRSDPYNRLINLIKKYGKRKLSRRGDCCDNLHGLYFNASARIKTANGNYTGGSQCFDDRAHVFRLQKVKKSIGYKMLNDDFG